MGAALRVADAHGDPGALFQRADSAEGGPSGAAAAVAAAPHTLRLEPDGPRGRLALARDGQRAGRGLGRVAHHGGRAGAGDDRRGPGKSLSYKEIMFTQGHLIYEIP